MEITLPATIFINLLLQWLLDHLIPRREALYLLYDLSKGSPSSKQNFCPVLSCPVLSCPVLSCPVTACLLLFRTILTHFIQRAWQILSPLWTSLSLSLSLCLCLSLFLSLPLSLPLTNTHAHAHAFLFLILTRINIITTYSSIFLLILTVIFNVIWIPFEPRRLLKYTQL